MTSWKTAGAVPLALIMALSGCGGGGGAGAAPTPTPTAVPAPAPTMAPAPAPTSTPTPPAPTAIALLQAKLKSHLGDSEPVVIADAPVVTPGAASAASAIPGARVVAATDAALRYIGRPVVIEQVDGVAIVQNQSVTGTPSRGSVYYVEVQTDAPLLEVLVEGSGDTSAHRIMIDGNYASLTPVQYTRDGLVHRTRVDFRGVRRSRRIRIESDGMLFGGFAVAVGDAITTVAPGNPVRAMFLGASSIEGLLGGDGFAFNAFAPATARKLGWTDLYISGASGTGYRTAYGSSPNLVDRFRTDVLPFAPEVIVISAGYNDTLPGVVENAPKLFDIIQAALPDTIVFVMGPIDPKQDQGPKRQPLLNAVSGRPNFYFIDNLGDRWQTGTGNVAAPKGDGNADQYVGADGVHLSIAGNRYIADRLSTAIRTAVTGF